MNEQVLSAGPVVNLRSEVPASKPRAVEVHAGIMLASGASIGAVRLATDLIQYVWWPTQAPLSFDVDHLSTRLKVGVPHGDWTPWRVRRYRAWAMTFFRNVGNDQWVPIADYYKLPDQRARQQATAGTHRPW
jgi:hypothetical protein